jgi:anti-sigma regulatory factor (Ser/Thr protein kinase)
MNMVVNEKRKYARGAELRLSVPPDPKINGHVRREVIAFAEAQGIADDDVIDFVGAVGEALANAIEHSHTHEPIEISAWLLGEDRLFACVSDRGIGFAATERTLAPTLPDGYAERGRGLPIMRRCSDVFSVRTAPGEGTRVTLGRHVQRAAGWREHHRAG